jgi:DNA-binding LacI/PurR family transcriptional regulator
MAASATLRSAVRLRDVADDAGVSVSTASRALANAGAISPVVRRRVRDAARRLGYPARPASGSALRTVRLLATLDRFSNDAAGFHADIIAGACDALERLGLEPDVTGLAAGPGLADSVAARQAEAPVDGLLLLAMDDPAVLAACAGADAPASVVLNGTDPAMRLDGVVPANAWGAALATRHLLELGHRRILYVGSRQRPTVAERFGGYADALRQAGLGVDPALSEELANLAADLAHDAMQARLQRGPPAFSAVVCGNDLVALGVVRALQDHGLRVPQDISVVGFDDVPTAVLSRPPLTTIAVDRRGIGAAGVRLLAARCADPAATPVTIQLGCRLVVRESTAPPAQHRGKRPR